MCRSGRYGWGSNPHTETRIMNYREQIEVIEHLLREAHTHAQILSQDVHREEGDSDLARMLDLYLTPNLQWWITGNQAGNIKYLNDMLDRRDKEKK